MEKKKTAGQMIEEARLKQDQPIAPIEFMKEGKFKNFSATFEQAIREGKRKFSGDFYLERKTQREWALDGLEQTQWLPRLSCPTPDVLQTAIKYHRKEEAVEHLWTIPSVVVAKRFLKTQSKLNPVQLQLLWNYSCLMDGSLLHKAKELNGELEKKIIVPVKNDPIH